MPLPPLPGVPVSEEERVRAVYRKYDADWRLQTQWDPRNPGNAAMWEEAVRRIPSLLCRGGVALEQASILDVGCGHGAVLGRLIEYGARARLVCGIDLQEERIAEARRHCPGANWQCADAQRLPFAQRAFDAVLCINLFGSILDEAVAARVAGEVRRVAKPSGAVVWCESRYPNPWNRNVRGYTVQRIRRLFPGCRVMLQPITVLPPLTRRLGRFTPVLYPRLARIPLLCVRYLGTIREDEDPPAR